MVVFPIELLVEFKVQSWGYALTKVLVESLEEFYVINVLRNPWTRFFVMRILDNA